MAADDLGDPTGNPDPYWVQVSVGGNYKITSVNGRNVKIGEEGFEKPQHSSQTITPDMIEPIKGFRSWKIGYSYEKPYLQSPQQRTLWNPHHGSFEAICSHTADHRTKCQCGVNAFENKEILRSWSDGSYAREPIVGEVELWGEVQKYERGYRAQYAKPTKIWATSQEYEGQAREIAKMWGASYEGILDPPPKPIPPPKPSILASKWMWMFFFCALVNIAAWFFHTPKLGMAYLAPIIFLALFREEMFPTYTKTWTFILLLSASGFMTFGSMIFIKTNYSQEAKPHQIVKSVHKQEPKRLLYEDDKQTRKYLQINSDLDMPSEQEMSEFIFNKKTEKALKKDGTACQTHKGYEWCRFDRANDYTILTARRLD